MTTDTSDIMELARSRILEQIDQSERGKWSIKIKTLMAEFGYQAVQRVRQSSLDAVLDILEEWNIECRFPSGFVGANEYITLSRGQASRQPKQSASVQSFDATQEILFADVSPLTFAFHIGETQDESRSRSLALDLQSAVWSFQPVCLLIEGKGSDEFFTFACGFFSAIMRRRALMVRHNIEFDPIAPEIVTVDQLKRATGQLANDYAEKFPRRGTIYILRENPDDIEDDDLFALTRECFVPHTYRLKAKFKTTQEAVESPGFSQVLEWMSGFAGTFQLSQSSAGQLVDMASLLAEASRLRDILLERQTLQPVDSAFRSGFESTEHMVLKNIVLSGLRKTYPDADIKVEELVDLDEDDALSNGDAAERPRRDKPDLHIADTLWVEIETLRGLSVRGSNPFFALESKLRQKQGLETVPEVWLIVPSDVALLTHTQMNSVARNLNATLGGGKVRWGIVDILTGEPVFFSPSDPPPTEAKLAGASWRTAKKTLETRKLKWEDIAGYSDVKEYLREGLLDPLLFPEKYARYNISAANGLMLYGLPGCGKSLIGRVLAGEAGLACRFLAPSDLTSKWLGEGVEKIRELFDWALKQDGALLVLDEIDAVAPQRQEANMHTDEKRQVNELLAQLDRITDRNVVVVATTNYVRGIDSAIQRSGRFDIKLPVFPPHQSDRAMIFDYYLSFLSEFKNITKVDRERLAEEAPLFTPADIKTVVQTAARRAIREADSQVPSISTKALSEMIHNHPRSIRREMALEWLHEATEELGAQRPQLRWLKDEITLAFGKSDQEPSLSE